MFSIPWVLCLVMQAGESPKVVDERLKIELFAEAPQVVTPVGIAVDDVGRVLCIESHTHFPPKDYQGPKTDRIQAYQDTNGDGRADKVTTFFDGLIHTMNLAIYRDGSVFVATRSEILRLRDTNQDGVADQKTRIAHLETTGNYPHNGLSGFAFDFAGNVYFGFGENLGADYKLLGTDGTVLNGGGEGGNIYVCDPDGKSLRRIATGFWNPFHLCFDAFGRLFAVDNDPDSRPPCRLLHIIDGGDYGYRFRNGRRGTHPFTSWNGELPGTLPMVAGTGEAPSGILAYESDNLPAEYRGDLLVTSWGDHRIERYQLKPRGASFYADRKFVVTGGENFRPVGIALAGDGSLYISDWVDKSYQLHGKGRIWRLSAKQSAKPDRPKEISLALRSAHAPLREAAARKLSPEEALVAVKHQDPRVRALAAQAAFPQHARYHELLALLAARHPVVIERLVVASNQLALPSFPAETDLQDGVPRPEEIIAATQRVAPELRAVVSWGAAAQSDIAALKRDPFHQSSCVLKFLRSSHPGPLTPEDNPTPEGRVEFALIARRMAEEKKLPPDEVTKTVAYLLQSPDASVQRIGIQWVGEERLEKFRGAVETILKAQANSRATLECCLATLELLDNVKRKATDEMRGEDYILKLFADPAATDQVRELALRTLRPQHPKLTLDQLAKLLTSPSAGVRLEAIRSLRERSEPGRSPLLRAIASNGTLAERERLEAIVGLSAAEPEDRRLIFQLAESKHAPLQREALRTLRGVEVTDEEKQTLAKVRQSMPAQHAELARRTGAAAGIAPPPAVAQLKGWLQIDEFPGDAEEGERVFFHPRLAGCYRCHEMHGRGAAIGPALTFADRALTREKLLQAIIYPSHEIAPQFAPWILETADGKLLTGLSVGEELDGTQIYVDGVGNPFRLKPTEIESRTASSKSIMPDGITNQLTTQEIRDLIAYLMHSRK